MKSRSWSSAWHPTPTIFVLETKCTAWRIFRATEQRLNWWRCEPSTWRGNRRASRTRRPRRCRFRPSPPGRHSFEHGHLVAGQSVLIHGGAGGVGSLAVQLAHGRDLRVLATASARDVAFVRSLGADGVIDYHAERFDEKARDVDMVLDTIGDETRERSWRVLRKGGVLVTLVSPIPPGIGDSTAPVEFFSLSMEIAGNWIKSPRS